MAPNSTAKKVSSRTGPKKTKVINVKKPTFRVIPLGGMGEIGKNFTVFECDNDIIIVDCGIKFPDGDMFGVDFVIPDFSYLYDKKDRIKGLFITHGHEDHIGAIPFFLQKFPDVEIYGTKLTIGLLANKLMEYGLHDTAKLNIVSYGDVIDLKIFSVEFVATNHSIPDSSALYIKCPGGNIFHTGDFKIDLTPVDGIRIDLARIAEIGKEGVDLLLADSTNAAKKGFTPSERTVGASFRDLFARGANKRIVVATFATNVHRVQQVFDVAAETGRKVAINGRSMVNTVEVARNLGYLKIKDDILVEPKDIGQYEPRQLVLLTTGSQGEPLSGLARMASNEHRIYKITEDDFVIISATPIPGNEKTVAYVISNLMKLGATVVYQGASDVHVSGHACQEELKIIMALVNPRYFVPCHGEFNMLFMNSQTAKIIGIEKDNVFILENGDVLNISDFGADVFGRVQAGPVFVDGSGIGDVGNIVIRDRKRLSQDGLFVVVASYNDETGLLAGPDIVSRGFVYMKESEELVQEAKEKAKQTIEEQLLNSKNPNNLKIAVKSVLEDFLFEKTKRHPMVMPIMMYIKNK